MRFQKKFDPFVHCCSCRVITHAIVEENHYLLTQLSPLKVSLIQNIFMKSSFRPKYQRNYFKDFCPSLYKNVE